MDAKAVDPRDPRWSDEPTGYRVFFWRARGPIGPRELNVGVPYESETYDLTDARDVEEPLEWARAHADGRTFTLYALHDREPEHGLIHLAGIHPTKPSVSDTQAVEVRRLFSAHGFNDEPLMYPVTTVDERVFVVTPETLATMSAVEDLVTSLESVLGAPVRIETE